MIFTQNCKTTLEIVMWIIIQMMVEPLLSTRSVFPNVNMWLMWMSTTQLGDTIKSKSAEARAQRSTSATHSDHANTNCAFIPSFILNKCEWLLYKIIFTKQWFICCAIQLCTNHKLVHKTMWLTLNRFWFRIKPQFEVEWLGGGGGWQGIIHPGNGYGCVAGDFSNRTCDYNISYPIFRRE